MKKLIPALVLLLVSAMVLSTSSYAWFSMNRTVSATGMSLTSTAPANLLITNGEAEPTWGATVISNEVYTNGKIFPASTADGVLFFALADGQKIGTGDIGGVVPGTGSAVTNGVKFYKGSDKYNAVTPDPNAPVAALTTGTTDRTGYWAEYTLKLKTTGSSAVNVYLSSIDITATYTAVTLATDAVDFTVPANQIYYVRTGDGTVGSPYVYTLQETGTSSATTYYTKNTIDDCVRVAIFNVTSGSTLVGIYDVGGLANDAVKPITAVEYNENGAGVADDTFKNYIASASDISSTYLVARDDEAPAKYADTNIFTVAGNQLETTLLVRVWIEGQNTKCINSIAGQNFNIGLTFNIKANAT